MNKLLLAFIGVLLAFGLYAQAPEARIAAIEFELTKLEEQRIEYMGQLETIKLEKIRTDLKSIGLPTNDYIEHSAMLLEYDENHEQAKWVSHVILPDIREGTVFRSNDFRPDPLVTSGTAVEADYFLKTMLPDSTYEYDGYGYDRGHLAPSADFRWSAKALSESYFYSNMSPQRPEFNREAWAAVERLFRAYLYEHPETQLYVVTGPVLNDQLPKVERSINKVSIPEYYFKVVVDVNAAKAVGFLMPNQAIDAPLEEYAVSVDRVEEVTGLNFFNKLNNEAKIESELDKSYWIPTLAGGDVEPLFPPSLPRDHFNTIQAQRHKGKNKPVIVCGTVVSTRYSRSGNLWMNLDKQFPNQLFSVFIRKKDLINFSYDPQKAFEGKVIAVKGKVQDFNGVATINLEQEEAVNLLTIEK